MSRVIMSKLSEKFICGFTDMPPFRSCHRGCAKGHGVGHADEAPGPGQTPKTLSNEVNTNAAVELDLNQRAHGSISLE
jgi:hypothetical protein